MISEVTPCPTDFLLPVAADGPSATRSIIYMCADNRGSRRLIPRPERERLGEGPICAASFCRALNSARQISYNRALLRTALNSDPHLTVCQWHVSFRATHQSGFLRGLACQWRLASHTDRAAVIIDGLRSLGSADHFSLVYITRATPRARRLRRTVPTGRRAFANGNREFPRACGSRPPRCGGPRPRCHRPRSTHD
jgi:hypothetical protein